MKKRIICIMCTMMILFSMNESFLAGDTGIDYQETHFQINFTDFNVSLNENNELIVEEKQNLSIYRSISATRNIEKLEEMFDEYPVLETSAVEGMAENGEIMAISFTEVPVVEIDGHLERIPINTSARVSSNGESCGKFCLSTTVYGGTSKLGSGYKYTAITTGTWSSNSIAGGFNYPDSGNDYVYQTTPNTFSRNSHSMSTTYDYYPTTGVNGDDYWLTDGNASYIAYAIKDDPLGFRQNKSFKLTTISSGPRDSDGRYIRSYYVHTWNSGISVSTQVGVDSESGFSLNIKPSSSSGSWQVYDYVIFNF